MSRVKFRYVSRVYNSIPRIHFYARSMAWYVNMGEKWRKKNAHKGSSHAYARYRERENAVDHPFASSLRDYTVRGA